MFDAFQQRVQQLRNILLVCRRALKIIGRERQMIEITWFSQCAWLMIGDHRFVTGENINIVIIELLVDVVLVVIMNTVNGRIRINVLDFNGIGDEFIHVEPTFLVASILFVRRVGESGIGYLVGEVTWTYEKAQEIKQAIE